MKKLLIVMSVLSLSLLLLAGCGKKKAEETLPTGGLQIVTPTGAGEAVVPEEGDIVIPIG